MGMIGTKMSLKTVYILIARTCEYFALYGKGNMELLMELPLLIS